jgi:hypothetical protein
MDVTELAWASGLFEGEGCITSFLPVRSRYQSRIALSLSMTDEDTVRRFARALNMGNVHGPYQRARANRPGLKKPYWVWQAASFEQAQASIAMLWSGLGNRRRARAAELLALANEGR